MSNINPGVDVEMDAYGRPRSRSGDPYYGPERHPYGPMRFEHQPWSVRKRGRKGKAGRRSSSSRGSRTSSRRGRRRSDYRPFLKARSETYGPVRFESQPDWVRARGRKGKAGTRRAKSRRGYGRKSSSRSSRRSLRAAGYNRRQIRQLQRSASSRMSRRSRRSSRSMSRRGSTRVLRMNTLYRELRRQPKMKAWVCVGPSRTGCGGGKRGGRGSRVFGVLRP